MPIEEAKRVTVKPNALVAEDLDFAKGAAEAGIKKATDWIDWGVQRTLLWESG